MPGETFMLIVFQRQLFGSYLQLARGGRLLATGSRGATASSSSDQVSHATQSYSNLSQKRDREHHSFEFRTTTLFRFDR